MIEGLYALGRNGRIDLVDLPRSIRESHKTPLVPPATRSSLPTLQPAEKQLVEAALRSTSGNKSDAARLLGISRSRLYHLIQVYRVRV